MRFPSVTLLVLNFNGMRYIESCLDSILQTDYPKFEVVVIDNDSQDDSAKYIRENYPQVRLIENKENYGFAQAYNLIIDSIETEYVGLLNNDIEVESDWLRQLVHYMEERGNIAAANPKMLFLQDKGRINAAGGNCDIYGVGWNRGNGEIDSHQYDSAEEVFYGNGAAMLIRRKVWHEIGLFDERYFMYGEDLDWCWRARLKGYKILYVPKARIYHYWKGSNGTMVSSLERHLLATLVKNYSLGTLLLIMPKYLSLKMLKAMWLVRHGTRPDEKLAVSMAIIWNLKNLKETWKKRLIIQSSRAASDKELQERMYGGSLELSLWSGKIRHPMTSNKTLF